MAHSIEARVCTIIAEAIDAPPEFVRPETALRLGDHDIGWHGLYEIADRLGRDYGIHFDLGAADIWTTVTDVIVATEQLVATKAAQRSAA